MTANVLAIDVGNSDTVIGLFAGGRLRRRLRLETAAGRTSSAWLSLLQDAGAVAGSGSIVSSVVPRADNSLGLGLQRLTGGKPLWVGPALDTGIRVSIPRPSTLGADRLANAAFGFHRFGGPLIIIDIGTATTLCAISPDGDYLGGAILPGLAVSLEALSARAAKLPVLSLKGALPVIGRTTESAMRVGALEGHRGAIERIARSIMAEFGSPPRVIATGGLARLVARGLPMVERVEPDLTLKALHFLYRRNASRRSR